MPEIFWVSPLYDQQIMESDNKATPVTLAKIPPGSLIGVPSRNETNTDGTVSSISPVIPSKTAVAERNAFIF